MAYTVTCTDTSGTADGSSLYVAVLTAATEAGGNSGQNTGVYSLSFTPSATNSLIIAGMANGATNTAYTLAANMAAYNVDTDGTNGWEGWQGHYSGTVTAATPVTVGATAGGTVASNCLAMYEIEALSGSTPVLDASTPAAVGSTGSVNTPASATTASFTPPAGSVLVAVYAEDGNVGTSAANFTISNTGGALTWTKRVSTVSGTFIAANVTIYTATVPGASASPPLLVQPGGKQWQRKFRHRQILPAAGSSSLTVNAGLATAIGSALDDTNASGLGIGFTPGLATGTGTSQPVLTGTVNAGLATGTGAAAPPAMGFTPGLATGTATAQPPLTGTVNAGLATGTGTSLQPGIAWTPGLATATGAAAQPGLAWTPGLATGVATSQSPATGTVNAGLATATGTAGNATTGIVAGLATAIGSAQSPVTGTVSAGLATGTGASAPPAMGFTPGLATATGTSLQPGIAWTPGLATATGTSQPPNTGNRGAGLATGTGAAAQQNIAWTPGLATGVGSSQSPGSGNRGAGLATGTGAALAPGIGFTPGLATGTGTAIQPGIAWTPGLATALGSALNPQIGSQVRQPLMLGGTTTPVLPLGGSYTDDFLGGSITYGSLLGGGAVIASLDNAGGGSAVLVSIDTTSGGTAVSASDVLGGTVNYGNTLGGSLIGWTMQQVNLTLAENNDETVDVAITSSGSPLNLTGATINMYLKTAAGVIDSSALLLSSAGGSPAITITNPSGGLCVVAIPHVDLYPETYTFYRIDVVFSGLQNTAIYGNITWITL